MRIKEEVALTAITVCAAVVVFFSFAAVHEHGRENELLAGFFGITAWFTLLFAVLFAALGWPEEKKKEGNGKK